MIGSDGGECGLGSDLDLKGLVGYRASAVIPGEYPFLDAFPVVGYAGWDRHRIFHYF